MTKSEAATYRKLVADIVAHPADEIRLLAVKQRSLAAEALRKVRDKAGELVGRWRQYDDLDDEIATHLKAGDELEASQKEEDRIARRRQYAYAYLKGREFSQQVQEERRDGSTYLAWFVDGTQKEAEVVASAAAAVGKKVERVATRAADTAENVVYLVAAGAALALYAFGKSRGQRK